MRSINHSAMRLFFLFVVQAALFRVFQAVFHAPRDPRTDELRRLAAFVVRQFVQVAPGNPKIFAELLFYKNAREAADLESNYDGVVGVE